MTGLNTHVRASNPARVSAYVKKFSFATVFVWSIFFALLLFAIICILKDGRNIPLGEDWTFVSPLTGNQNGLLSWAWAQYNEHRIPLPRLVLFCLLKITRGDFRSGMFLNVLLMAAVSVVMVLTSRHLRNGKTSITDAFFPVGLLNAGNSENLFWSCNVAMVLPAAILLLLLVVFVTDPLLTRTRSILVASIAAVMLPLCGAIGLMFAPFTAIWLLYRSLSRPYKMLTRSLLLLSAAATFTFIFFYFQNYRSVDTMGPDPVIPATLLTAGKFVALAFGIAVIPHWNLFMLLSVSLLICTAILLLNALVRGTGFRKHAAAGCFMLFVNHIVFALAVGWGRAAQVPYWGLPARYTILAFPIVALSYYLSRIYGSRKVKNVIQYGLLATVLVLLPSNTVNGSRQWNDWYTQGMISVEQDLKKGVTAEALAERHGNFLIFFMKKNDLVARIKMLHNAGIGPFRQLKPSP